MFLTALCCRARFLMYLCRNYGRTSVKIGGASGVTPKPVQAKIIQEINRQ